LSAFDGPYSDWTVENNVIMVGLAMSLYGIDSSKIVNNTVIPDAFGSDSEIQIVNQKGNVSTSDNDVIRNNLVHTLDISCHGYSSRYKSSRRPSPKHRTPSKQAGTLPPLRFKIAYSRQLLQPSSSAQKSFKEAKRSPVMNRARPPRAGSRIGAANFAILDGPQAPRTRRSKRTRIPADPETAADRTGGTQRT
jgi:hypothetical protein